MEYKWVSGGSSVLVGNNNNNVDDGDAVKQTLQNVPFREQCNCTRRNVYIKKKCPT